MKAETEASPTEANSKEIAEAAEKIRAYLKKNEKGGEYPINSWLLREMGYPLSHPLHKEIRRLEQEVIDYQPNIKFKRERQNGKWVLFTWFVNTPHPVKKRKGVEGDRIKIDNTVNPPIAGQASVETGAKVEIRNDGNGRLSASEDGKPKNTEARGTTTDTVILTEAELQEVSNSVEAAVKYLMEHRKLRTYPLWWVLTQVGYPENHPLHELIKEVEKRLMTRPDIKWKFRMQSREGKRVRVQTLFIWFVGKLKPAKRQTSKVEGAIIRSEDKGKNKGDTNKAGNTDSIVKPAISPVLVECPINSVPNHDLKQSKKEISMPVKGGEGSNMTKSRNRVPSTETVETILGILEKGPDKKFTFKELRTELGYEIWQPTKLAILNATMSHSHVNVYFRKPEKGLGGRRVELEWVNKATVKEWTKAAQGNHKTQQSDSTSKHEATAPKEEKILQPQSKISLMSVRFGPRKGEETKNLDLLLITIKETVQQANDLRNNMVEEMQQKGQEAEGAFKRRKELLLDARKQARELNGVASEKLKEVTRLGQELRRFDRKMKRMTATFSRLKQ